VLTALSVFVVRTLHHFHQQLSYCVSQFVDKDPELSVPVLQGLLRYWPVSNSAKEVLYLNELEQVLELTQPEEFGLLVVPLFKRVALCIASPHFQVAERALFLWHNEYISHLIAQHREDILPLLYPVLAAASQPPVSTLTSRADTDKADSDAGDASASPPPTAGVESRLGGHWNPTVNNLTQNVLKIFVELDGPLVDSIREDGRQKEEQQERSRQERTREWRRLEDEEKKVRGQGRRIAHSAAADDSQQPGEADEPVVDPVQAAVVGDAHTHQVGDLLPSTSLQSPSNLSIPPPTMASTTTVS
jgi:serine/threonine-protein phosphatase 2A regulatory subunit B'